MLASSTTARPTSATPMIEPQGSKRLHRAESSIVALLESACIADSRCGMCDRLGLAFTHVPLQVRFVRLGSRREPGHNPRRHANHFANQCESAAGRVPNEIMRDSLGFYRVKFPARQASCLMLILATDLVRRQALERERVRALS